MDVDRRRDQRDDHRGASVIFQYTAVVMTAMAEEIARKASLRKAKEFSTPEALKEYLKEHPEADPKRHTVTKKEEPKKEEPAEKEDEELKSEGRFSTWKNRFKSLSDSAKKFVEEAPKAVKHFLGNDEFRQRTLDRTKDTLLKLPKKAVRKLIDTAKEEVHEFKEASAGVKNLMTGKKMTDKQKKAFKQVALHIGIAAGAAAFAASGPLSGAGLFGKGIARHIAAKAMAKSLENLHLLEEGGHIGEGLFELVKHIAADESIDPDEAMAHLIMAAVAKEMEELTDEELAEVLNNMKEKPEEKTARRVVSRYLEASDIKILEMDFIGDREPPEYEGDPDFTTDVAVTFELSGMALARLFDKQRRVLERFLEKLDEKTAIRYINTGGRKIDPIMATIENKVEQLVSRYTMDEFDANSRVAEIALSEDTSFWSADIDPQRLKIKYTVELDVIGRWM